jgi:SAM-dependent methyltransferase
MHALTNRLWKMLDTAHEIQIPKYVSDHIQGYQLEEFRQFFRRIGVAGIRGKSVLEIGSDYYLAIARLFSANGAKRVVATSIGDWRSPEPLPSAIEYAVGDMGDLDLGSDRFDIVYGVAILEHVPDLNKVAHQIRRILAPGGIAYLQGCPLWASRIGHHVIVRKEKYDCGLGEEPAPFENLYDFADEKKDPIPGWSHLTCSADAMIEILEQRRLPRQHAERIAQFVYNIGGKLTGSCSNFKCASQIISAFEWDFIVECDRTIDYMHNDYFTASLSVYSELDLRTVGLRLWLTPR